MQERSGRVQQLAADAYNAAAGTLSPAHRIVMLLDGAIGFLARARAAIADGRIEDRHRMVLKARAIVDALQACLDLDQGGAVAANLDRLYTYLSFRMSLIDLRNDPEICLEVAARLAEMREAWATLAERATRARPAPTVAALGSGPRLAALSA